jgi:hypothetical protein
MPAQREAGEPPEVFGESSGVSFTCACGKAAMDGIRCSLGATHKQRMPWEIKPVPFKMPWET